MPPLRTTHPHAPQRRGLRALPQPRLRNRLAARPARTARPSTRVVIHDPYVTTQQAAEIHGVDASTVRQWASRGLLVAAGRIGRQPYYRLSDVDRAEHLSRNRDKTGRASRRDT